MKLISSCAIATKHFLMVISWKFGAWGSFWTTRPQIPKENGCLRCQFFQVKIGTVKQSKCIKPDPNSLLPPCSRKEHMQPSDLKWTIQPWKNILVMIRPSNFCFGRLCNGDQFWCIGKCCATAYGHGNTKSSFAETLTPIVFVPKWCWYPLIISNCHAI